MFRIIISIYTHFIYVMIEQFRDVTCIPPGKTKLKRRNVNAVVRIFIKSEMHGNPEKRDLTSSNTKAAYEQLYSFHNF